MDEFRSEMAGLAAGSGVDSGRHDRESERQLARLLREQAALQTRYEDYRDGLRRSQRPAVIIFNHQSQADLMIIARLVRRDLAGVGKQEIRRMPFIGKMLEMAGAVFIDRENTARYLQLPLGHL